LKVNPATIYRYAWKTLEESPNQAVAKFLLEQFTERVVAAGYHFGTIQAVPRTEGDYTYLQRQVSEGGTRYIQDRHQHGYIPTSGEVVLFRLEGVRLTTTVVAVRFIPAHSDRWPR
jgi:hypothetical protein